MKKIIVQKGLVLLIAYFIMGMNISLFAQKYIRADNMNTNLVQAVTPNRLIMQFTPSTTITQIANILSNENATIIDSILDFGLNIFLVEFPMGNNGSFPTIQDAHKHYTDYNGDVLGQTNGSSTQVQSVDYDYNTTTNTNTTSVASYDVNNYHPNPNCTTDFNLSIVSYPHNIKIAVVDSGQSPFISGPQSDFNHLISYTGAYDYIDDDTSPDNINNHSHGTNVSSIIAGLINGYPNIKIVPIRILNQDGETSLFTFYQGLVHAISIDANIINLSVGIMLNNEDHNTNIIDSILQEADDKNILVIAAAGNNDGSNIDDNTYLPSSSEANNLLVVGSSYCDQSISSFSNVGAANVDIFATGENVVVYPTTLATGTSFAAPQVTAIAAIKASKMISSFDSDAIKNAILNTATNLNWTDDCVSGGILNPTGVMNYFNDDTNTYAKSIADENASATSMLNTASKPISNEAIYTTSTLDKITETDLKAYFSNSNQMELTINSTTNQEAQIKLISLYGDTVADAKLSLSEGTNTYSLQNLNHLPTGIYLVYALINNQNLITQKCFKQ